MSDTARVFRRFIVINQPKYLKQDKTPVQITEDCEGYALQKNRYQVDHRGRVWQVDFYESPLDSLIIAECEIGPADTCIDIPVWMYDYREVTDTLDSFLFSQLAIRLSTEGFDRKTSGSC